MRMPSRFAIGAATHTGLVRGANEDDYLLVAPEPDVGCALLAGVADGLGGAAGGAEASRTGLRSFAVAALDDVDASLEQRVRNGFAAASRSVQQQADLVPALRGMATTMVAVAFSTDRAVLGHVGDSRAYLYRAGALRKLTEDHASKEDRNRLLRCVGGGVDAAPDVTTLDWAEGDRLLLCTDGVWGYVAESAVVEAMRIRDPQAAAGRLIASALQRGGPDNGTAVVVDFVGGGKDGAYTEIDLPREEQAQQEDLARVGRLGAPLWPLALLALAAVLAGAAMLRVLLDFDVFAWVRSCF